MTTSVIRVPAILAGALALAGFASIPAASAAVRHGHVGGVAVHRTAHATHAAVAWRGGHRFVSGAHVAGNRHYGYGWRRYGWGGATVAGGVVGVGVSYPYYHHSCWWYLHYAPYAAPSWCGYGYGYAAPVYGFGYGAGYGGYRYGHGGHFVTGTHVNRVGMGAAHGARMAAIPHGGMHMGGHAGGHFVH